MCDNDDSMCSLTVDLVNNLAFNLDVRKYILHVQMFDIN